MMTRPRHVVLATTLCALAATAVAVFVICYSYALSVLQRDTMDAARRDMEFTSTALVKLLNKQQRRVNSASSATSTATLLTTAAAVVRAQCVSVAGVRAFTQATTPTAWAAAWATTVDPTVLDFQSNTDPATEYSFGRGATVTHRAPIQGVLVPDVGGRFSVSKVLGCRWSNVTLLTSVGPVAPLECQSQDVKSRSVLTFSEMNSLLRWTSKDVTSVSILVDTTRRVVASSLTTSVLSLSPSECVAGDTTSMSGFCQVTVEAYPFAPLQNWASQVDLAHVDNQAGVVNGYAVLTRRLNTTWIEGNTLLLATFVVEPSLSAGGWSAAGLSLVFGAMISTAMGIFLCYTVDVLDRQAVRAQRVTTAVRYASVDDATSDRDDDDGAAELSTMRGSQEEDTEDRSDMVSPQSHRPSKLGSATDETPTTSTTDDRLSHGGAAEERSELGSILTAKTTSQQPQRRRRTAFVVKGGLQDWTPYVSKRIARTTLGSSASRGTAVCIRIVNYKTLSTTEGLNFGETLDSIYSAIDDLIMKYGGTLFTVQAEFLVAVFGCDAVPVDHPELRACICSRWILESAATKNLGTTADVAISIGVSSGTVLVVNLCVGKMINYICQGATVDQASLLERSNELLGTRLLAARSTMDGCSDFVLSRRMPYLVRVKSDVAPPIEHETFEVVGPKLNAPVSLLDDPFVRGLPSGSITAAEAESQFAQLSTDREYDVFLVAFHSAMAALEAGHIDLCLTTLNSVSPLYAQDRCLHALRSECERRKKSTSTAVSPLSSAGASYRWVITV